MASLAKSVLTSLRDEVVDCFDSVVYAESTSERMMAVQDIFRRHQTGIALIGVGVLFKTVAGRKRAKYVAVDAMKKMRDEEAKKWGSKFSTGWL
jgi:uncharacterized protein (DUF2225 family)